MRSVAELLLSVAVLLWLCCVECDALLLPSAISSHMVLQRAPSQARLWGEAGAGSEVTVVLDGHSPLKTFANSNGSWLLSLPPQAASTGRSLLINADNASVTLENIAFGDVFLCAGQSKSVKRGHSSRSWGHPHPPFTHSTLIGLSLLLCVVSQYGICFARHVRSLAPPPPSPPTYLSAVELISFPLSPVLCRWDGNATIANATSARYPHLRLFAISEAAAYVGLKNTTNRWKDGARWVVTAPQYLNGSSFDFFSAVCFYFGQHLYDEINRGTASVIPIGLVESAWGGSCIEAWTTEPALLECGPIMAPAVNSSLGPPRKLGNCDSSALFHGMISPILNMALRSFVWFQGAANEHGPVQYACRFPAMIRDWRRAFNDWSLPFLFVLQSATPTEGYWWAELWAAQLHGLSEPYTAVASGQDLGDRTLPAGPGGLEHSRNKTILGHRLTLLALHAIYGQDHLIVEGPTLVDIIWPSANAGPVQTVLLRFAGLPQDQGLILRDTSNCPICCGGGLNGSAITLATSDGRTLFAEVTVFPSAFVVTATVPCQ